MKLHNRINLSPVSKHCICDMIVELSASSVTDFDRAPVKIYIIFFSYVDTFYYSFDFIGKQFGCNLVLIYFYQLLHGKRYSF